MYQNKFSAINLSTLDHYHYGSCHMFISGAVMIFLWFRHLILVMFCVIMTLIYIFDEANVNVGIPIYGVM